MAGIPNRNVAHRRSAVEGLVRRHGRTFQVEGRLPDLPPGNDVGTEDITAKKAMPDGARWKFEVTTDVVRNLTELLRKDLLHT